MSDEEIERRISNAYMDGIDDLFCTKNEEGQSMEDSRNDPNNVVCEYNDGWNACYDAFKRLAEQLKEENE